MELKILTASTNDLETILALQQECYVTEAALHQDFSIPPLTQTLASITADFEQGTLFLKGMVDGQLIGSVRGFVQNGTAYIGRLIVQKTYQNNRFGQALMKEIERQLCHAGRYELFTGHKSEKNLGLYTKLGYTVYKRQVVHDHLTLVYWRRSCKAINAMSSRFVGQYTNVFEPYAFIWRQAFFQK